MKLTEIVLRNSKPRDKPYKLSDGHQMYLLVLPAGGRYWRLDFSQYGKRGTLALGTYPAITLKEARGFRDKAKLKLARREDPKPRRGSTFGDIAAEWFDRKVAPDAAPATVAKTQWLLNFTKPIAGREITSLTAPDILSVLRRVEVTGKLESARRLRSLCSRVFRYAIAIGHAERDVCVDLAGALTTPPEATHRAAPLTPEKIGALIRAMHGYTGHPSISVAMRLGALTFVRPYELRFAVWDEFELDAAVWRIPAARMKMRRDHIVPLSKQSVVEINRLKEFYEPSGLLFPSMRSDQKPISENTVNKALRSLGFAKDEATHHGFRRMASTILNEHGFAPDWIERQLAHVEGNKIRGAYNAAEYLEGRTQMMQRWADLLDEFEVADMIG
jgi:integrase